VSTREGRQAAGEGCGNPAVYLFFFFCAVLTRGAHPRAGNHSGSHRRIPGSVPASPVVPPARVSPHSMTTRRRRRNFLGGDWNWVAVHQFPQGQKRCPTSRFGDEPSLPHNFALAEGQEGPFLAARTPLVRMSTLEKPQGTCQGRQIQWKRWTMGTVLGQTRAYWGDGDLGFTFPGAARGLVRPEHGGPLPGKAGSGGGRASGSYGKVSRGAGWIHQQNAHIVGMSFDQFGGQTVHPLTMPGLIHRGRAGPE